MKIIAAYVRVEIELEEDEGLIGTCRSDRLICDLIENEHVKRVTLYPLASPPHPPSFFCGCGQMLDRLEQTCPACVAEAQEWREDDLRQRYREAAGW